MQCFDCDEVGELKEYVRYKVEVDQEGQKLKITQPVLLQSYADEFLIEEARLSTLCTM